MSTFTDEERALLDSMNPSLSRRRELSRLTKRDLIDLLLAAEAKHEIRRQDHA